jgi:hypothetical protein
LIYGLNQHAGHVAQRFRVAEPARPTGKVDYDGCKDMPGGPVLLEAKGNHRGNIGEPWFEGGRVSLVKQAEAQSSTATRVGAQLEWHVQTKGDAEALNKLFERLPSNVNVRHTPMPEIK